MLGMNRFFWDSPVGWLKWQGHSISCSLPIEPRDSGEGKLEGMVERGHSLCSISHSLHLSVLPIARFGTLVWLKRTPKGTPKFGVHVPFCFDTYVVHASIV